MDETSQKAIDATMSLIHNKGYAAATTKDIARQASVNECTLLRKFKNRQGIMINGVSQEKWRTNISEKVFQNVQWELQPDLEMFMWACVERITPDFMNLSIGLRAPQIYSETAPLITKIPQAFLTTMTGYLEKMERRGKIAARNYESFAMTIFSSAFGYTFSKASLQQELTRVEQEEHIKNSTKVLIGGTTRKQHRHKVVWNLYTILKSHKYM